MIYKSAGCLPEQHCCVNKKKSISLLSQAQKKYTLSTAEKSGNDVHSSTQLNRIRQDSMKRIFFFLHLPEFFR